MSLQAKREAYHGLGAAFTRWVRSAPEEKASTTKDTKDHEGIHPRRSTDSWRLLSPHRISATGVYFSISADQLRMTDNGAELVVSILVLTRNF
jgi:hypothetical protein